VFRAVVPASVSPSNLDFFFALTVFLGVSAPFRWGMGQTAGGSHLRPQPLHTAPTAHIHHQQAVPVPSGLGLGRARQTSGTGVLLVASELGFYW
jgi:hypothetical protein